MRRTALDTVSAVIRRFIAAALFVLADCGPHMADDDIDDPIGVLVYAHPGAEFYRLDRRIEVVSPYVALQPDRPCEP
jgi:hypothetical protein